MMRLFIVMLILSLGSEPLRAAERVFDFANDSIGQIPSGFRSVLSGSGKPGEWKILLDDIPSVSTTTNSKSPFTQKRRVLAQVSQDQAGNRFPLLIYDQETLEDFVVTTSFKLVAGDTEQMAGIAFRIQDANNYYYIRASALGTNVSFFKMVAGQLVERVASPATIPLGVWQELKIDCRGSQFRCSLNGKELLLVTDVATDHVYRSGKIGFWTKSDSVSYFADTRLTFTTRAPFAQELVQETFRRYDKLLGLRIYVVTTGKTEPSVIASLDPAEVGTVGGQAEEAAIKEGQVYFGKIKGDAHVTMPLRDRNGDPVAAVRVVMNSFPGQTQQNAIVRATPIVKRMQARISNAQDLLAR